MDFVTTPPQMGAVIRGKEPATSISFHLDGVNLFVASEGDDRLRLIDCQKGTSDTPAVRFEQEGIRLVESTHNTDCVLFSGGGKSDQRHDVYYHSLYDNKILRKFRGHTSEVTNISMCPANDTFLTSSKDRTVRLWNLGEAGCLAQMQLPADATGSPHAVFDSTGLVLGITVAGSTEQYVHLYDARNYASGAFAEFKVPHASIETAIQQQSGFAGNASEMAKEEWSSIQFNASGTQLLAFGREKGLALLLDGFEGTVQKSLCSEGAMSACFASDDKTVLLGNKDGTIGCWSVDSGTMVKKLGGHTGPVGCIAANPKYSMFASCCTSTALWIW